YLGGIRTEHGTMMLTLVFLDSAGKELVAVSTKPIPAAELPAPPAREASMINRSLNGLVPAGTRKIEVRLVAKYLNYAACKNRDTAAFADNLSLVLREKKDSK